MKTLKVVCRQGAQRNPSDLKTAFLGQQCIALILSTIRRTVSLRPDSFLTGCKNECAFELCSPILADSVEIVSGLVLESSVTLNKLSTYVQLESMFEKVYHKIELKIGHTIQRW